MEHIEWVDRESVRYSDGNYSVVVWVDYEPGLFSSGRIIREASIDFWEAHPPNTNSEISNEDRARIVKALQRYYARESVKCRVET